MAKSSLEIVLVDENAGDVATPPVSTGVPAGAPPASGPRETTAAPPAPKSPSPPAPKSEAAPKAERPPREERAEKSETGAKVGKAAEQLAGMVGLGGIAGQLKSITGVFSSVKGAIESLAKPAVPKPERETPAPTKAAPASAAPPVSSAAPKAESPTAAPQEASAPEAESEPPPGFAHYPKRTEAPPKETTAPSSSKPDSASAAKGLTEAKTPSAAASPPPVSTAAKGASSASGGVSSAAGAALKGLGTAATVGAVAVAGVAVAAGLAVAGVKKFSEVMSEQAQKLKDYSPDVAFASAINEVREELSTLRRAEKIGPQLARFEDTKGKINEALSDLWSQILKILLDLFEAVKPLIDRIPPGIDLVTATLEFQAKGIEQIFDLMTGNIQELKKDHAESLKIAEKMAKSLKELVEGQIDPFEEFDQDPLLTDFFNSATPGAVSVLPPLANGGI